MAASRQCMVFLDHTKQEMALVLVHSLMRLESAQEPATKRRNTT